MIRLTAPGGSPTLSHHQSAHIAWLVKHEWLAALDSNAFNLDYVKSNFTFKESDQSWSAWLTVAKNHHVLVEISKQDSDYEINIYKDDSFQQIYYTGIIDGQGSGQVIRIPIKGVTQILKRMVSQLNQSYLAPIITASPQPSHEAQGVAADDEQDPTFTTLESLLEAAKVDKKKTFAAKLKGLFNVMGFENAKHFVRIGDLPAQVFVEISSTNEYFFNAVPNHVAIPEKKKNAKRWYEVCFYDNEAKDDSEFCMRLRIAADGTNAELVSIKRSPFFSGNELLKLTLNLLDRLQVPNTLLYDCAVDDNKIPISMMGAIGDRYGKTWYARHGFSFYDCKDLKVTEKLTPLTQSKVEYQRGLAFLRNTKISDITKFHYKKDASSLEKIAKGYSLTTSATLHQLTAKVLERRKSESQPKRDEAKKDVLSLYNLSMKLKKIANLNPYQKDQAFYEKYLGSLNTINRHQLMIRKHR